MSTSRRQFLRRITSTLGGATALGAFPPAIRAALAIPADRRRGTIEDVEHIVLLMMENRSFDHYFGAMNGVRGFADRFPIPVPDGAGLRDKTVWYQRNEAPPAGAPAVLAPQRNDTTRDFALLRNPSTPHLYPNAQDAWDHGRMARWPQFKTDASMVYFTKADLPFQFALADAFTLCDANHCSMTGGTNPNRCFFFTGTNQGRDAAAPGVFNGPAVNNAYNRLHNGPVPSGYTWTSYAERLEDAGVSWQIYQNEEVDFDALNSLLGFRNFREAHMASVPVVAAARTPRQQALYEKGIRTRDLDLLRADVVAGRLPKVSWICPTASASEHPETSSPAQGAAYVARVLEALTANPAVWSRTALIVNFDENDGLFDHVPPPAPPSYLKWDADPARAVLAGASTVDARDEYLSDDGGIASVDPYRHRPFGLGPRVPMFVISPWSKGGWVNSQVFDQTSTIRFVEARFGVREPNISAWRRAVTGDLTSCFDFARPDDGKLVAALPDTTARDAASRALGKTTRATPSSLPSLPEQPPGVRRSRALPYELQVDCECVPGAGDAGRVKLHFDNTGRAGAVFHVYDRHALDRIPRRFTVEAGKRLSDSWTPRGDAAYDLWVLGPNGFHRHFTGLLEARTAGPEVRAAYDRGAVALRLALRNDGSAACVFVLTPKAYLDSAATHHELAAGATADVVLALGAAKGWYDLSASVESLPSFGRRLAGRLESGQPSISDPAMHGGAVGEQYRRA